MVTHLSKGSVPFRCRRCDRRFLRKKGVIRHLKKSHPKSEVEASIGGTKQPLIIKAEDLHEWTEEASREFYRDQYRAKRAHKTKAPDAHEPDVTKVHTFQAPDTHEPDVPTPKTPDAHEPDVPEVPTPKLPKMASNNRVPDQYITLSNDEEPTTYEEGETVITFLTSPIQDAEILVSPRAPPEDRPTSPAQPVYQVYALERPTEDHDALVNLGKDVQQLQATANRLESILAAVQVRQLEMQQSLARLETLLTQDRRPEPRSGCRPRASDHSRRESHSSGHPDGSHLDQDHHRYRQRGSYRFMQNSAEYSPDRGHGDQLSHIRKRLRLE